MAQGDFQLFDQFKVDKGNGVHDLSSDSFKLMYSTAVFSRTTSDPRYGAGGSTNLVTNEVSGGNYVAGGAACANPTWADQGSGDIQFDTDDPATLSPDAGNPADIKSAVLYNDTAAGKNAVGWVDMTNDGGITAISAVDGLTFRVNASGWFTEDNA